ncbi:MAG: phosphoribosyl-ATP diphosphatase, partial [Acidimicrobiia bacterium]|nr:phosphoribosyl-ATP diphosphatase [Acidimicrobiia bacterium]
PVVGGFLFTQVEHEGAMAGFDFEVVERAVQAAGTARVTAAGGITTAADIARLHAIGADAQVGMALYSGSLALGDAVAAPLTKSVGDRWPTVVVDEGGQSLGLVWSTRESVAAAIATRKGIYWSRSRDELWEKGATSGATQQLLRVDLDCDADALRFTVRQHGAGFCHTGDRSCWDTPFSLHGLDRVIGERLSNPEAGSGTAALLADPSLLAAKITEEAGELNGAADRAEVVHEAADLLYFTLVRLRAAGASLVDVEAELGRRNGRVRRRPMTAREPT